MSSVSLPASFQPLLDPSASSRQKRAPEFQALFGPLLASSVLLGFSVFATVALGLPRQLHATGFLIASALFVYAADAVIDHFRTSRAVPWPSAFWLVCGLVGMALTAVHLRFQAWCVVATYLPLGLLWTVRFCPVWQASERRIAWRAPRELSFKPWLLSTIFATGCIGVPWAQGAGHLQLPLGPQAWLSAAVYVPLVLLFVLFSCAANAITMDAADFFAARTALSASGVVDMGLQRLKRQWLYTALAQFVLALTLALGSNSALIAAPAVVVATYTALSTRSVFETPNKWWRSMACDGQGLAIVAGLAFAWFPTRLAPVAQPFAGSALADPNHWPTWLLWSVMIGAVAWLLAYGLMLLAGRQDRTYAVPAVALLFNLGWELNHAFIAAEEFPSNLVNVAWFVLDVGLMAQLVAQTPARLEDNRLPRSWAGGLLVLGTLLVYVWQVAFDVEFANHTGEYSACIGNTLMSALFLHRGVTSSDLRGQRFSIAVAKGVGSALYVAPIFVLTHSRLLLAQGLLCATLDVAYGLVLLHRLALPHPTPRSVLLRPVSAWSAPRASCQAARAARPFCY